MRHVNIVCSVHSVNSIKIIGRQRKEMTFSYLKNISKEKKEIIQIAYRVFNDRYKTIYVQTK